MRRLPLLFVGLLLITPAAHASGVFLKWDACHADGGVSARSFACDTNSGFETLVGSVVLDTALVGVVGTEMRIVGQSASGVVPAWWTFLYAGSCRQSSASIQSLPAGPVVGCPSLLGSQASGGLGGQLTNVPSPGAIQFRVLFAIPDPGVPAAPGQEYFLFALRISHAKTVGSGACSGCLDPMCLGVGYIQIITSPTSPTPGATFRMSSVPVGQGHLVSWQNSSPGGVYSYQVNPPFGHLLDFAMTCDAVTPVRRSTWGAVRSLYR
jgi:hypothetical protein